MVSLKAMALASKPRLSRDEEGHPQPKHPSSAQGDAVLRQAGARYWDAGTTRGWVSETLRQTQTRPRLGITELMEGTEAQPLSEGHQGVWVLAVSRPRYHKSSKVAVLTTRTRSRTTSKPW